MEYQGKDAQIKQHLLQLRRGGYTVRSDQIAFGLIGKRSQAHIVAIGVYRGTLQPNLILTLEDLMGEFQDKKIGGYPEGKTT